MNRSLHFFLVLGLIALFVPALSATAAPLKIGISPNGENSISLAEFWIPFLEELETKSGIALRFATAPDLLEFNQRLTAGEYDLVITDQYLFTIFRKKHQLSYLAELTTSQGSNEMALVTGPGIAGIAELEGGLLAVKQDEKAVNVKALDQFLSASGVTALRDNLLSYDKILQSISEKLHVAGLVPVTELDQNDEQFSILWRTSNKHSYIITYPQATSRQVRDRLTEALDSMMTDSQKTEQASQVEVKSVRDIVRTGEKTSE
ncbi:PhnD/SsuA/transferrin family substrate-binding protein [Methylophaga sp.]|uniref:PhnD/SsuA/transferrin family substrate-binding protein n=1 Tax=Methylophaga sp. TaxID=2024840 RepID=UPI0014000E5E|nr:PhnD/SsuA/transferrin family substrate-binding protein [Methylophaga sp.]MTI63451.1 phosphate/phosphite/phosphonate ABC transporter substrate-binding protein [Methylophaga sp.]